jgi:hypothetical protein
LSITAADMVLTGTIDTGAGNISLLPSVSETVGLGAGAGSFSLSDTELDNITTSGTLTIGNANTTTLTVDGWTAAASISGSIVLVATGTAGQIVFSNNATTATVGMSLTALAGVTLNVDVTTQGATTINTDSDANGVGDFTVAATKTLSTSNNSLSITANDITLSGNISTGSAALTLLVSDAGTIGLGATTGNYTLSGAELQRITATGLTLGDNTNGSITVDGISAGNSANISGTVSLVATLDNASISFTTAASSFNALSASADDGIAINVNLTTLVGNLTLEGDADNSADSSDAVSFASGLTITAAGSMSIDATTGGIVSAAALTLNAVSGITLNDDFTKQASGAITINADSDANGTGSFTLAASKALNTATGAVKTLSITAADMGLTGTIDTGSGNLS